MLLSFFTKAFADTLFIAQEQVNLNSDAVIFTQEVEDPSHYGVVVTNAQGEIIKFVEKPAEPISNQAIIGIYYFKHGELLKDAIQYIIDNDIKVKGEYQLTDALELMLKRDLKFTTYTIDKWLDCGNLKVLRSTLKEILLQIQDKEQLINSEPENSVIIPPVYIGENVQLKNSVIGPYTSIEQGSVIENSIISNSIILDNATVKNANITESVIGKFAEVQSKQHNLEISDYSKVNQN